MFELPPVYLGKRLTQVKLKNEESFITAWVDSKKVKLNRKVTLKEVDGWWEIIEIYASISEESIDKLRDIKFLSIEEN